MRRFTVDHTLAAGRVCAEESGRRLLRVHGSGSLPGWAVSTGRRRDGLAARAWHVN